MWFSRVWRSENLTDPPADCCEELLLKFRRQKGWETDLRESIVLCFTRPPDGTPWRVTLTLETIEDAWRHGIDRPLRVAAREVARLVRVVDAERVSNPVVIVSGGTARNPAVKSRMEEICEQHGVPVVFTDDFLSILQESVTHHPRSPLSNIPSTTDTI